MPKYFYIWPITAQKGSMSPNNPSSLNADCFSIAKKTGLKLVTPEDFHVALPCCPKICPINCTQAIFSCIVHLLIFPDNLMMKESHTAAMSYSIYLTMIRSANEKSPASKQSKQLTSTITWCDHSAKTYYFQLKTGNQIYHFPGPFSECIFMTATLICHVRIIGVLLEKKCSPKQVPLLFVSDCARQANGSIMILSEAAFFAMTAALPCFFICKVAWVHEHCPQQKASSGIVNDLL